MPLIDLALLEDRIFIAGMCATFCFFLGNLSFYFVLTLCIQNGLGFSPFDAALTVMPLAFAFVVGSRMSGGRLIEGCVVVKIPAPDPAWACRTWVSTALNSGASTMP